MQYMLLNNISFKLDSCLHRRKQNKNCHQIRHKYIWYLHFDVLNFHARHDTFSIRHLTQMWRNYRKKCQCSQPLIPINHIIIRDLFFFFQLYFQENNYHSSSLIKIQKVIKQYFNLLLFSLCSISSAYPLQL